MARVKLSDLERTLAAHALRDALRPQKTVLPLTLAELQVLCVRETRPRIHAGYLRAQREEISRLLARVLVENVSELEAEFLRRHYRDGKSVHHLALHLHASERHLYILHERILHRLSSLLFYRVSIADAYAPLVPLNLLAVLDMRISTFVLRAELPVTDGWLASLYSARARCRALLELMAHITRDEDRKSEYERIICAKMQHPFAAVGELAEFSGVNHVAESTIHAYLRRYLEAVKNIVR